MEIRLINNENKIRLDKFISENKEELSRNESQILIKNGRVKVNGKIVIKESSKLNNGDEVIIYYEKEEKEISAKPENIKLDIVYEDDDILVVNKPKGMVVHPAAGNKDKTLVNALLYYTNNLSNKDDKIRPGIVHRLDKNTSGLLIVAKNDLAHKKLSEMLKKHEITKIYICLVNGNIKEDNAKIDMPISRDKIDRKKMSVNADGKEAITHFKVIRRYGKYTLLKLKIDTGRTHQIRVHMSKIGHPIVGDDVYSNGKNEFGINDGQMLHSYELEFNHPITGKKICLKADIPQYFKDVLEKLDKQYGFDKISEEE